MGGVLAILGSVAAPIISGDTAFRSARLIIADFMHYEQKSIAKRLTICVPLFVVAIAILVYSLADKDGFEMIWRYFAWCNQTLAVFTLWAVTVYLTQKRKQYWVTLVPALFMTSVVVTYICYDPVGMSLPYPVAWGIGVAATVFSGVWFFVKLPKLRAATGLLSKE